MPRSDSPRARAAAFCADYGLEIPVLMAPMAGACPPELAAAVAGAGGMGACGALTMDAAGIAGWARAMRAASNRPFQMNLWIPDPAPARDAEAEAAQRGFLARFGPEVPASAGDAAPPDFDAQSQALLATGVPVVSSIMGLYPPGFVADLKARGGRWFATVTTVAEARAAEAAGADVLVVQGAEAGGHRGAFEADRAGRDMIGLFALLPAVARATSRPLVATGGIGCAQSAAAAMVLGASAVQIGTALLRSPEAGIAPTWAAALEGVAPEDTVPTRAYSGRLGRALRNDYLAATEAPDAPAPAPYPVQRGLTGAMRAAAGKAGDIATMQAWAGQAAGRAEPRPAGDIVRDLWAGAEALLPA